MLHKRVSSYRVSTASSRLRVGFDATTRTRSSLVPCVPPERKGKRVLQALCFVGANVTLEEVVQTPLSAAIFVPPSYTIAFLSLLGVPPSSAGYGSLLRAPLCPRNSVRCDRLISHMCGLHVYGNLERKGGDSAGSQVAGKVWDWLGFPSKGPLPWRWVYGDRGSPLALIDWFCCTAAFKTRNF